ncbi:hypothetical protein ACWDTI_25335 [Gordonia sp. NPDC003424]
MKKSLKGALTLALGTAAAATAVATATPATAVPMPPKPTSLTINGDLHLTPTVRLLHIDAKGMREANGMTSGTYTATMLDGMNPTPIQVRGPITCISVMGDRASLVYPISDVRPFGLPPGLRDAFAIQISVRKGHDGRMSMVGVNGPMPTANFRGCAPMATPFAFQGTITTSGG